MAKRILITSTDLMMIQFLVPHVINLSENGFDVEIACSNVGGRMDEIHRKLKEHVKKIHIVRLVRSPINPINIKGYKDMQRIIEGEQYDIIWTNEPVMGVATRLAARCARKRGTKVLYMVHGFHFYNGAPKLNWLLYYPIERLMASKADMIVTVNKEDYQRAQSMDVKQVEYIHGIGINTDRLSPSQIRGDIRKELGLTSEDFIVLSVGELNKNKNQKTVIQAIATLNDPRIHYVLCGKGNLAKTLSKQVSQLRLDKNVHFLGYRKDVVDICSQSDIYVMPSRREGLPVASLEAMYCGLPLVTSNIRGLVDVMENGVSGYLCKPNDTKAFANAISHLKKDVNTRRKMGLNNKEIVKPFCINCTKKEVLHLICNI